MATVTVNQSKPQRANAKYGELAGEPDGGNEIQRDRLNAPSVNLRESWLSEMVAKLLRLFQDIGVELPENIHVSCGFPHGRRGSKQEAIGQCWARRASRSGNTEIFVSPVLDDAVQVSSVLVHELIHAADDCLHGHGPEFRKIALAVGLRGPMRATIAGPELMQHLNALCAEMGPYPHARIDVTQSMNRKQGIRLIKVVCDRRSCSYALWTTRKWLDLGTPFCTCGSSMSEIARRR